MNFCVKESERGISSNCEQSFVEDQILSCENSFSVFYESANSEKEAKKFEINLLEPFLLPFPSNKYFYPYFFVCSRVLS